MRINELSYSFVVLVLFIFMISLVSTVSAIIPVIPEVGDGSCVPGTPGCQASAPSVSVATASYRATGDYADRYSYEVYKGTNVVAINTCVRACNSVEGTVSWGPYSDCFSQCESEVALSHALADLRECEFRISETQRTGALEITSNIPGSISLKGITDYSAAQTKAAECSSRLSDLQGDISQQQTEKMMQLLEKIDNQKTKADDILYNQEIITEDDIALAVASTDALMTEIKAASIIPLDNTGLADSASRLNDKLSEVKKGEVADVDYVQGQVEMQQPDGSWRPLAYGAALVKGAKIRTGEKSRATIILKDGSRIEVGQRSEYQLEAGKSVFSLNNEPTEISLKLLAGKVKAWIIPKLHRQIRVTTSSAILSVRGTEFIAEYDSSTQTSAIYLNEGSLDITNNNNETQQLESGNMMTVDRSGQFALKDMSYEVWSMLADEIALIEALPETSDSLEDMYDLTEPAVSEDNTDLDEEVSSPESQKAAMYSIAFIGACILIAGILISRRKISKASSAFGITGLVLSILSIPLLVLPFLGLPFAILAVIFSRVQNKTNATVLGKIGSVIGIIGIVLNTLTLIAFMSYLLSI